MDENTEMLSISVTTGIDHLVREERPVQRRKREGKQCDGENDVVIEECLVRTHETTFGPLKDVVPAACEAGRATESPVVVVVG